MSRATHTFSRPADATAVDPFTLATPHFGDAWRTCERTGPAFEITGPAPLWYRIGKFVMPVLALVGAFTVLFAGLACAHG